jgi:hypothetical protein
MLGTAIALSVTAAQAHDSEKPHVHFEECGYEEIRPVLSDDGLRVLYWVRVDPKCQTGKGERKAPAGPTGPGTPNTPTKPDDKPTDGPDKPPTDNEDGDSDDTNGDRSKDRSRDDNSDDTNGDRSKDRSRDGNGGSSDENGGS